MMIWLAFFLLLVGITFARMGPSFSRNKFAVPIIMAGISLLAFNNFPVENPEEELLGYLRGFAPWFFVCSIGCFLVLRGSPIYWKSHPPQLIIGWSIILISFYLNLEYYELPDNFILMAIFSALGGIISLIFFIFLVRFVENRIPLEDPAPDLTEEEIIFVKKIISANIGVDEK